MNYLKPSSRLGLPTIPENMESSHIWRVPYWTDKGSTLFLILENTHWVIFLLMKQCSSLCHCLLCVAMICMQCHFQRCGRHVTLPRQVWEQKERKKNDRRSIEKNGKKNTNGWKTWNNSYKAKCTSPNNISPLVVEESLMLDNAGQETTIGFEAMCSFNVCCSPDIYRGWYGVCW